MPTPHPPSPHQQPVNSRVSTGGERWRGPPALAVRWHILGSEIELSLRSVM